MLIRCLPLFLASLLCHAQSPSLNSSTVFGGNEFDHITAVAYGPDGTIYVTGSTASKEFHIRNAAQSSCNLSPTSVCYDHFLARFSADGRDLLFSTYLGSDSKDEARAITVDREGNVYVAGNWSNSGQISISRFTPSGFFINQVRLRSPNETLTAVYALTTDSLNRLYVTGQTSEFQVALPSNAYQNNIGPSSCYSGSAPPYPVHAFVLRFSQDLTLERGTYFGGSGNDIARAIAIGPDGDVWIAGETSSSNLPLISPIQSTNKGGAQGCSGGDAFVARFNPDLTALRFSTFLGGSGKDGATALSLDLSGATTIAGSTASHDFPSQSHNSGGADIFIARLKTTAPTGVSMSVIIGGGGDDYLHAMAADASGTFYLAGATNSSNFPLASPYQATLGGCLPGQPAPCYDAFLTQVSSGGTVIFSTLLGGDGDDHALAIALSGDQKVVIGGEAQSRNFPTYRAFQPVATGTAADGFFSIFSVPPPAPAAIVSAASDSIKVVATNSLAALTGYDLAPAFAVTPFYGFDFSPAGTVLEFEARTGPVRAPIISASPTRIVFQATLPVLGPGVNTTPFRLIRNNQIIQSGVINMQNPSPALFSANGRGAGAAAAVAGPQTATKNTTYELAFSCNTVSTQCATSPITAGTVAVPRVLYIYGTGLASAPSPASAEIGGLSVQILSIAATSVPGVDEIALALPASLAGKGRVPVRIVAGNANAISNLVEVEFK
ncbi:MAG: SBBP repeat-containing protein [Bryobacteraceae bacterium]|nr:SBBP repeat-containing protein [Bryobacteraceae bacterium]